jgi:hypothetical protein
MTPSYTELSYFPQQQSSLPLKGPLRQKEGNIGWDSSTSGQGSTAEHRGAMVGHVLWELRGKGPLETVLWTWGGETW